MFKTFRFDTCSLPNETAAVAAYNCAQYVPIKKTIRALLKIPEIADLILNDNIIAANPGEYNCYQDGSRFKESAINRDEKKKYVLQFQLYEDGMSITNPFSANSSIHSSGMFYFRLLNVPGIYF